MPNTAMELDTAMADAIEWIVRLSSGEATDEDAAAFHQWHDHDPAHADAWRAMNSLRPAGRAIADGKRGEGMVQRRAFLAAGVGGIAALGLVSLTRPPLGLWPSLAELMADHRTGTAQHYAFTPRNGVKIELNARTSVGLADAGRSLNLIDGQAFVTVAPGADFQVQAGDTRIEASNTAFDVETVSGTLYLGCASGEIRCATRDRSIALLSGEQLAITATGTIARSSGDPADVASWRAGLLVFKGAPLRDVIARINRYRSGAIILADSGMGSIPITAHVFTNQIDDAVPQLVRILDVRVRTLPGGIVLLG